ncbi:TM2 domain containing protein [Trichomonas vaginalis G3]|uniref:TM2 domain containing protein n=1 Tax=Trichomonas vaginalis (strain ATCC PRA-98 / G3) TaxID=412133 RepID=A2DYP8_TRIV3|nr:amyloid-beta binding [Trichomonas vaginalis G3]EAY14438.1 TM2 domain containing protein [Trichomonas vaginalis G3]KAI5499949.1 amyloid-beta binding [Trichomonas vaginalis G3]|eukprot:XP_001326661.1 TM2 domain containing protein [Trichomonas vaginalis G3]
MFSIFVFHCQSTACKDSYPWQYSCVEGDVSNISWATNFCYANNTWIQNCTVYDTVECTGNRTFSRYQWCPNRKGKSYSLAVVLSCLGGLFGFDRFYLGYTSLGFIKFFTFGIFFVDYILDIILILTQYLQPADGNGYSVSAPFPIIGHGIKNNLI